MVRASLASLIAIVLSVPPASAGPDGWRALRDGSAVALIRHARAPGTGDPAHFRLDDPASQRNLDAVGRAQARRIGDAFRANGIASARVFSSQWRRARDTAALMDLGEPVDAAEALNSFFEDRDRGAAATAALRALILRLQADPAPAILVTHQVNVTALTGVFPREGEIVAARIEADGRVVIVARIPQPWARGDWLSRAACSNLTAPRDIQPCRAPTPATLSATAGIPRTPTGLAGRASPCRSC